MANFPSHFIIVSWVKTIKIFFFNLNKIKIPVSGVLLLGLVISLASTLKLELVISLASTLNLVPLHLLSIIIQSTSAYKASSLCRRGGRRLLGLSRSIGWADTASVIIDVVMGVSRPGFTRSCA